MRVVLAVLLTGCSFPAVDLENKACDTPHACPDDLVCVLGVCKSERSFAYRPWSAQAVWNTPVGASPELAADSSAMIAKIASLKEPAAALQCNRDVYTPIVAFADADSPLGTISDGVSGGWRLTDVPMPADADTAGDPNGWLVIIDRARGLAWNSGGATRSALTITAPVFGLFDLDGPGLWSPAGSIPSGRESNMSYLGGLIFAEELSTGYIPHAIAVSIDPSVIAPSSVPPALTSAVTGVAGGVPVGALLQLDPELDASGFGREAQAVAQAWKTFGAYVVERGAGFAIYLRSTHNLPSDPYDGMDFSGLDGELLRHLQVIAPKSSYAYDSALAFSPPMPHRP